MGRGRERDNVQLSPWIEPSKPNFMSQEIPFLLKQVPIGFLSHTEGSGKSFS